MRIAWFASGAILVRTGRGGQGRGDLATPQWGGERGDLGRSTANGRGAWPPGEEGVAKPALGWNQADPVRMGKYSW